MPDDRSNSFGRSEDETSSGDPIAIVGVACRLPGGINTLDALWRALVAGRDLVGEAPPDRFDSSRFLDPNRHRPGKSYTFAGGFLDDIAGFDADFFGLSSAEANRIDPQQRLLLELAVEAIDDAGMDPASLAGSDTGVYIGVSDQSYLTLQGQELRSINAYTQSGGAPSNTANRLSHWMNVRGPSVAMDTACSSSLVALHHACETLRSGAGQLALVGGVNVLVNPYHFVGFAKASMLSPTGRCHTFSAAADGYVRAEGGAVVVLRPLAAAQAEGDRVHGVILATATNSDGRTQGLSRPSPDAQEALLREVYDRARVAPDDLAYLEAHGTGTVVGDVVECEAIGRALGSRRSSGRALPIGSIKTNIGHLEAASGIAGVLKGLLVLRHGMIPASLHASPLNPSIDFVGWRLEPAVVARPVAGLGTSKPTVVGVNSFGFGGANAHVVLARSAPPPPAAPGPARAPTPALGKLPVVVSAHSPRALLDAERRMAYRLEDVSPEDFYDLSYTACRRRGRHAYGAAVLARDPWEAARRFRDLSEGPAPVAEMTVVPAGGRRVVFVFSGNGSQWAGMGADLLEAEPAFRAAVEGIDRLLGDRLGWSVIDELAAPPERSRLHRIEVAQPALFALQVGLVELLREGGVIADAVAGHSVGEIAAAYVAGALDLGTAALVVAERSHAQARTASMGGMAAVGMSADEAAKAIAPYGEHLEVAAVNSDRDVTISGKRQALDALGQDVAGGDVFFRMLDVDYPFHSRAMDPLKEPFLARVAGMACSGRRIPMASTVTGHLLGAGDRLDGSYWWRNVRQPVLFAPAVRDLAAQGYDVFVEVGPHPVLGRYLKRIAAGCDGPTGTVVATLSRDGDGPEAMRGAVTQVMGAGGRIHWDRYFPRAGRVVNLPAYPWQRERHWNGSAWAWGRTPESDEAVPLHPLLGERLSTVDPTWSGTLERARVPWLADHRIGDTVVMPAAAFVELGLATGRRVLDGPVEVYGLETHRALVVPWDDQAADIELQVSIADDDGLLSISSRSGSGAWQVHARGRVRRLLSGVPDAIDPGSMLASLPERMESPDLYAWASRMGLRFGPRLRLLHHLSIGPGEVLAPYELDEADGRFEAHPAILDGALQAGFAFLAQRRDDNSDKPFLMALVERARIWQPPTDSGLFCARVRSVTKNAACWDVTITDTEGRVAAELLGCWARRAGAVTATPRKSFQTVLRAAPRPHAPISPVALVSQNLLAAATTGFADALPTWVDYGRFQAGLRDLQAAFVARAVTDLLPGRGVFAAADLVIAGVVPKYARLLDLLLGVATRAGFLQRVGDDTYDLVGGAAPSPEDRFQQLAAEFPDTVNILTLYGRCGSHLAEVLRGTLDPTQMLFADNSINEQTYELPETTLYNWVTAAVVKEAVSAWPADRPLRVLEVGAGTGATTAALLPLLPAERTQYVFTDISRGFLPRAKRRFAAYDFVEYRCFDLESEPSEQGIAEAGYDIVVASNVLHATSDLRATLARLANALDDNGWLLVAESHDPGQYALCFALLDGYWLHTDSELRSASCLLPRDAWPPLLRSCEFTDVAQVAGDTENPRLPGSVILARRVPRPYASRLSPPPPVGEATTGAVTGTWIIVAGPEDEDLVRCLSPELATTGPVHQVRPHAHQVRWNSVLAAHDGSSTIVVITGDHVSLADRVARTDQWAVEEVVRGAAMLRCIAVACDQMPGGASASLCLVTRPSGAIPASERLGPLVDAGLWGVARSLANEEPQLTVMRVSLERGPSPADDARRLAHELRAPCDEDEVVLTGGGRFVPRLVEVPPALHPLLRAAVPFVLEVRDPGPSCGLAWSELHSTAPGPHDVVIEVRAAGLNYRDIMIATGMMPVDAEGAEDVGICGLGWECAGIVAAVGSEVTAVCEGDHVFAISASSLASHVVVDASLVGLIPDAMSFTAAATLPVVFFTVHYGLDYLARLAAGEVVLVHSGSGGIGLAALQYAQRHGASMIATAGSATKRDLLRMLGVEHVLDSRSLDFADQVQEITGGRGIDIVVNSLAGEAVPRSLELLAPLGRFVELGKRDIHGGSRLSLGLLRGNRTFFAVDAATMLNAPMGTVSATMVAEVAERIWSGEYRPLPHSVFPTSRIDEAFRLMQHARHLGKVVVSFDQAPAVERRSPPVALKGDSTYLVTGGLGGLGGVTAGWLGDRGAGHLALVSRSGANGAEAATVLEEFRSRGISATAYQADVTDGEAMGRVLAAIAATGRPLKGVVHAAMALDDDPLREVGEERFRSVLRPKMLGGLVLDQLTRDLDLDLFVVFSSVAALVGNMNQSSYVAGNLALEALVRARRDAGRAGLAVAWGSVGEVGYVARNDRVDSMLRLGLGSLSVAEVRSTLEELLDHGADVVVTGRFDWERMARVLPMMSTPRFASVVNLRSAEDRPNPDDLRRRLRAATGDEARALVTGELVLLAADVLETSPDRVDPTRSLNDLGMDSLTAAALEGAIRRRLACGIPALEINASPTLAGLAKRVLLRLDPDAFERASSPPSSRS